jgi:hypothetical protein
MRKSNTAPASPANQTKARALLDAHGLKQAASLLGMTPVTVVKIANGARVLPSTDSHATMRFRTLEKAKTAAGSLPGDMEVRHV